MIEPEQVKQGRLQVVDVDLVLHDAEAELVGASVGEATLHAAAGEEKGEGVREVIATEDVAS